MTKDTIIKMMTISKLYLILVIFFVPLNSLQVKLNMAKPNEMHKLPRFWTNTGFCPMGEIVNKEIVRSLLTYDVRTNIEIIAALPNGATSKIRIHWLLELVRFIKFNPGKHPEYDFKDLDRFLDWITEAELAVGFELMGNPNGLFNKQNISKEYLWEDLVFTIVRRYKIRYGLDAVSKWQFETWNEPDLKTYNLLNFTRTDYLNYIRSVRRGLDAAGRTANNFYFELSWPAGLFKNQSNHQLCWSALERCNNLQERCFFDKITFHRKGLRGEAKEILMGGLELVREIFQRFPNLKDIKFSNDEADPIAGWSTPRQFQSDVHYATTLVLTVLQHWSARLNSFELRNLDSISHDNAFLSYHPHEFEQRTLLARFQMNATHPRHTQFIQKPVYAAMGLLGNLAEFAEDMETVKDLNISYMVSRSHPNAPLYSAVILLADNQITRNNFSLDLLLPNNRINQTYAYLLEAIETDISDPVKIWKYYGSPAYPNETVRMEMRDSQGPKILHSQILDHETSLIRLKLSLRTPWVALLRICSSENIPPLRPYNLRIRKVNPKEVIVIWSEIFAPGRCLKSYEVYFKGWDDNKWVLITKNIHQAFLSFQFQPQDGKVRGQYKVRGVDLFQRVGHFSDIRSYI